MIFATSLCVCFHFIFFSSSSSTNNPYQVYHRNIPFAFSRCMSLIRSMYKKMGLELIEIGEIHPFRPKKPHKVGENRDVGVGDPIKLFL